MNFSTLHVTISMSVIAQEVLYAVVVFYSLMQVPLTTTAIEQPHFRHCSTHSSKL